MVDRFGLVRNGVTRFLRWGWRVLVPPAADIAPVDLERLEDRILYSASPLLGADFMDVEAPTPSSDVSEVLDQLQAAIDELEKEAAGHGLQSPEGDNTADQDATESSTASGVQAKATRELIFIDTDAEDFDQLVADLMEQEGNGRKYEIHLLDNNRDGIQQITETLANRTGIDAVHLVSHGTAGQVNLGNAWLTSENVDQYAAQIALWNSALTSDADLLFYGCDLAGSDSGRELLQSLGVLCNCDVAASDDATGHEDLGGDWDLEYADGVIETEIAFSEQVQQNWFSTLPGSRISGKIYEDVNGNGDVTDDGVNASGVTIDIYLDDGTTVDEPDAGDTFVDTDTTNPSGNYQINNLADGTYWVVVNSLDVSPDAGFNATFDQGDVWAEQTYGDVGSVSFDGFSYSFSGAAGAFFGGMQAGVSDDASSLTSAQHVTRVVISGADATVDYGFSFQAVSHTGDADDDLGNDRTSQGSLRQGVQNSNAISGANSFTLNAGTYNLALSGVPENAALNGDLDVTDALTITGTDADTTIVDANDIDRVFDIHVPSVTFNDLTVQGGDNVSKGGGILIGSGGNLDLTRVRITDNVGTQGGGIHVAGTLTATDVDIHLNTATSGTGGGLENSGDTTLDRVTIRQNTAEFGGGVNVANSSDSFIATNTTISGNTVTASAEGGGIWTKAPITLMNVTIASNSAFVGGGIYDDDSGPVVTLTNTILADNTASFNPDGLGDFISGGNNLVENTSGISGLIGSDITGVDPELIALAANGGFTMTHALQGTSQAIDNGTTTGAPTIDQREETRDASPDIGAYERTSTNSPPVNSVPGPQSMDVNTPLTFDAAGGNLISISDPDAGSNPVEVTLTATNGTVTVSNTIVEEFQVNNSGIGDQKEPDIAADANGNYVVAWHSDDADGKGVFFQLYDSNSNPIGPETQVNTTITGNQEKVAVAMDDDGDFVVVWQGNGDQPGEIDDKGIFFQRFDSTGTPQGSETRVNSTTTDDQTEVDVAMDANGNFAVTWSSKNQDADTLDKKNVYVRVFFANGTERDPEQRVNTTQTDDQKKPQIAMDADGDFVVAWQGNGDQVGQIDDKGVFFQRFDADGSKQGGETRANTTTADDEKEVALAMKANGDFVVAWEGKDADKAGVFFQRFAANGSPQGIETQANATTLGDQKRPAIDFDDEGDIVVVWERGDVADDRGVVARQFDSSGVAQTNDRLVNNEVAGNQERARVIATGTGDFVVTWQSDDQDGDRHGIYAEHVMRYEAITFTAGDGIDDVTTTSTGTINDLNLALDRIDFTPTFQYAGAASLQIVTDDLGNTGGPPETDDDTINITVNDVSQLWVTTAGDENSPSDVPGLGEWDATEILTARNPNLNFGAGVTDATFASLFDLEDFITSGGGGKIDALHFVSRDITVGNTTTVDLETGDLLLSVEGDTELNGTTYEKEDIILFEPNSANDYTGGTFSVLIDASDIYVTESIAAISLVEVNTLVGDATLQAGTFLIGRDGSGADGTVYHFTPDEIGATTTGTTNVLLDELDLDINAKISGLELVEVETSIANATLAAGSVLVSLDADDPVVGDTPVLATEEQDIFYFTVATTGPGTSAATATMLLDGSDVNLDSGNEDIHGLTLISNSTNAAPTLADTAVTLNNVAEDSGSPSGAVGTLISQLADLNPPAGGQDNVTDPDASPMVGLAIIGADAANGIWHYSTDGGSMWNSLGAVSAGSARVLAADANTRVYFQANADYQGTMASGLTFRAWDQTDGNANGTAGVDTTTNGGTTAYSTATDVAALTVTNVNDAPLLDNSGVMSLTDINEDDFASTGDTVANIVLSAGGDRITDPVDPAPVEGIAVIGVDDTNGTWQYNTGGPWIAFGAVTNSSAVLLDPTASIRFVPNADYNGPAGNITFRAWDQTDGNGSGATGIDVSVNGGTTAYSTATEVASLNVLAQNDAPTLADTVVTLNNVAEDAGPPSGAVGTLISQLADLNPPAGGQDNVGDIDAGPVTGLALIGADTANGTWNYSTNGGAVWNPLGAVTAGSARLLAADANTRVYFQANADYQGTIAAALTFRAWDQTDGNSNGTGGVDTTTNGGTTAYSTATDVADITVTNVNDAPLLDNTGVMSLTDINEDDFASAGDTVANIVLSAGGDRITDPVDPAPVEGIAVIGVDDANGTWQYNTGGPWLAFGAVTNSSAVLLDPTASIRFVPNSDYNGPAGNITFRAWDQTDGNSSGATGIDVSVNGGTTAFSTATEFASLNVNAVNDAPTLSDTVVTLNNVAEDAGPPSGAVGTLISDFADLNPPAGGQDNVGDVDAGPVTGIALIGADTANGTWHYSTDGGSMWNSLGGVSAGSARVLAADANTRVYFQPNADYQGTIAAALTFRSWDQTDGNPNGTAGVDTTTNGGTTAYSTATDVADITVTNVNDAPLLDNTGTMSLTDINEDDFASPGDTVANIVLSAGGDRITDPVDPTPVEGIAVIGVDDTNGTWQYNTGGPWIAFGAVTNSSAVLLDPTASIRFVPNADYNGPAGNITFRAWDQTDGNSTGDTGIDVSVNGGTRAYSTATEVASLNVNAVNDAPTLLDTVVALNPIAEDAPAPVGAVGTLLSSIADLNPPADGQDNVTEVDIGPSTGLALVAADTVNGSWWYTTDGGAAWNPLGAVTASSARVLAADANTRVYFQPNADYTGTIASALTFRAWDQTDGNPNGTAGVDTTTNGGITAYSSATDVAALTVTAVNDAATLANVAGDSLGYSAGSGALSIEQGADATVGDIDSADFDTGNLTVDIVAGGDATEDELSIKDDGMGPGQIGFDGTNVFYGGTLIGTAAGGSGGVPLAVTFNAAADASAAEALVKNITYENTDAVTPTLGARTVRYTVDDGDGDVSLDHDATVNVVASAPPTITNLAGDTLNYTEDDPATVIEQGTDVTVTDGDSLDFDTGNLTVSVAAGGDASEDVLSIRNQGMGAGQIGFDGTNVFYGGTLIGTAAGGSGGVDLVVTFNANADDTAADALIENVTYQNTDTNSPTTSARTIRFTVNDGDGATSSTHDATVNVALRNDAPLLDASGLMLLTNVAEDDPAPPGDTVAAIIASAGGDRITDVDAGALEGIAVVGVDDTNGTWQYDAGSGWTAFGAVTNSSAVLLDAADVIRFLPDPNYNGTSGDITFRAWDQSDGNPNGATGIDVSVNGGTTAYSTATEVASLTVTPLNDAATLSNVAADTLAYGAGSGALVIDQGADATVADIDSTDFDTGNLTVNIVAGGDASEDELSIKNDGMGPGQIGFDGTNVFYGGTLIGTAVGGSGGVPLVVTFNAAADATATQALVKNVTYENTDAVTPTLGARTVRFTVDDGDGDVSLTHDATVNVSMNIAPTIANLTGDTLAYTEDDPATVIEQGTDVTVGDLDSTDFDTGNLTVSVAAGGDATEDVLSIRNQGIGAGQIGFDGTNVFYGGTLIGTAAGGSGGVDLVITFNASANATSADALIENITYQNTDTNNPIATARTIRYTLNDGDGATSSTHDATVTVTGINDAASLSGIEGLPLGYTENDGTRAITSTLAVGDVDDTNLESATIQITANYLSGEDVLAFVDTASITGSWDALTGTLTLTGTDTLANYQAALRSVTYENISEKPATATRTISSTADDGDDSSNIATRDVAVTAVNDAATLSGIEASTLSYTENDPATAVTSSLVLADVDDANLESATIQITAGYAIDEDVLTFVDTASITSSWNPSTGTLTLTGTDMLAKYEAALRSVTYTNTSEDPSTTGRTVRFTVHDGDDPSNTQARNIDLTSVNDPPVAINEGYSSDGSTLSIPADGVLDNDGDVEGDSLTASLITGPAHGTLLLSGDGSFVYTPDTGFSGADSFVYQVSDGLATDLATVHLTVTPIAAPPPIGPPAPDPVPIPERDPEPEPEPEAAPEPELEVEPPIEAPLPVSPGGAAPASPLGLAAQTVGLESDEEVEVATSATRPPPRERTEPPSREIEAEAVSPAPTPIPQETNEIAEFSRPFLAEFDHIRQEVDKEIYYQKVVTGARWR